MHVRLDANGLTSEFDLTAYCNAAASVRGLYAVPGRSEVIAVLTYVGRAYGCENVDLVVLFAPRSGP